MEPITKYLNYVLYIDKTDEITVAGIIPFDYTGEWSLRLENLLQIIAQSDPNYTLAHRGVYYVSPKYAPSFGDLEPNEFQVNN